ncbi:MAG: hypothetical protein ACI8PZ_000395 [Myxococcota bacterium]
MTFCLWLLAGCSATPGGGSDSGASTLITDTTPLTSTGTTPTGTTAAGSTATGTPRTDTGRAPITLAVRVNEFMASNVTAFPVGLEAATPDWIELYNADVVEVDLAGWSVADSGDGTPSVLPAMVLPAGGFVLLLADGDPDAGPEHLDFKLAAEGEAVVLRTPRGRVADQVNFGMQAPDVSAARIVDGDEAAGWSYRVGGTPGRTNAP